MPSVQERLDDTGNSRNEATTSANSPVMESSFQFIPPTHPARTLVLCFDGTGDQFDADNSNVVQFFSMLKKDDRQEQMVYYHAGIGTYSAPEVATPFMAGIEQVLDTAIAWNLSTHVTGGYEFLMQTYEAGDKICIFGFSRGAYTARALAGMIHKVGLLPACNHQQVPFAYKMFTRIDEVGWAQSTAFKKAFSMDVDIEFVGVWDTVSSVGLIPKYLPFTASNTALKTFRHAVSLDERRAKFRTNLFNRPTKKEQQLGVQPGEMPKSTNNRSTCGGNKDDRGEETAQMESEKRFSLMEEGPLETDVLEVWFAGCHCDVGGGSVSNNTRHNLARIPLRWMIRQCFLTNTGIRFHADLLRTVGLDPSSLYPVVKPRPPPVYTSPYVPSPRILPGVKFLGTNLSTLKLYRRKQMPVPITAPTSPSMGYACVDVGDMELSEEEEDLADALSPIYDQLQLNKAWWIFEVIPMKHRIQREDDTWTEKITMNLGRGRRVPAHKKEPFYVHRSVNIRMGAKDLEGGRYAPKARISIEPTWVD